MPLSKKLCHINVLYSFGNPMLLVNVMDIAGFFILSSGCSFSLEKAHNKQSTVMALVGISVQNVFL